MIKFLKWFFGLFSSYVHPFERKVDKFFKSVKSTDSLSSIRKQLLELMQENLIVTNVWMEKKYKGYIYLNKKTRRKMYEDVKKIVELFKEDQKKHNFTKEALRKRLDIQGCTFPDGDEDKLIYLAQIMAFLHPGKYYHYIKTASFGKLLRDPKKRKLEGDCNQIVTLYSYLFSLKYSLSELKINLLPEHVCLNFRGIDIECTSAKFHKYRKETQVLPITEIISTNLLDLTDFRENVQKISQRTIVKSSQLAYAISSLKTLVSKNLDIAYRNLAVSSMNANDFKTAAFYASKSTDRKFQNTVNNNAAIYYMKNNNFSRAYFYASQVDRKLAKQIKYNEGVYYYKNDQIDSALKIFMNLGDNEMKKACYAKKYNELQKKVSGVKTLDDVKKYKSTYKKMLDLSRKMDDSKLEKNLRETLSKL